MREPHAGPPAPRRRRAPSPPYPFAATIDHAASRHLRGTIRGARGCNTRHQPRKYPRKSPARPSATSIVTRLSQGSPPKQATRPRSAPRFALALPFDTNDRRSGSHIHARDPSAFAQPRPRARNAFAMNRYIPLLHDISLIQTTDRPDGMVAYVVFGDGEPCARVAETGNGNPQLLAHPLRGASCGCQLPRNFGNHFATKFQLPLPVAKL